MSDLLDFGKIVHKDQMTDVQGQLRRTQVRSAKM